MWYYIVAFAYNITMTPLWARWRLKSPASPVFTQPFIRAEIKENIKAPGTGEFPAQMTSNAGNISIWWRHHGHVGSLMNICVVSHKAFGEMYGS